MNPQIRDKFYDEFLKEPTKDNFRDFIVKNFDYPEKPLKYKHIRRISD